ADGVTATWDQVVALTAAPHQSLARSTDVSWGGGTPTGLGLTIADNWTLRFEGEIWLEAGDWLFYLAADDHGFVELASPGGAFAAPLFDGCRSTTSDDTAPAAVDWAGGAPTDLGISGADDFTVRWAGQWRVELPGLYYLRYVSDDGQRLWIDGALVLDSWDQLSHEHVSPPLDLAAGWHDIVVDQTEHVGDAKAMLTIDS